MKLPEKLIECIASGQPLLTILTPEYSDVENDVSSICQEQFSWDMWVWDSRSGLQTAEGVVQLGPPPPAPAVGIPAALQAKAPKLSPGPQLIAAIEALMLFNNLESSEEDGNKRRPVILMVRNLHRYWRPGSGNDETVHRVIEALQDFIGVGKVHSKHLIGLMPDCEAAKVPPEIDSLTTVIRHSLPEKDEFRLILAGVEVPDGTLPMTKDEIDAVVEASCGLTRQQAEKAYAVSSGRPKNKGRVVPAVIEEIKNEILNTDGTLARYNGLETFDDIGGNDAVKDYMIQLLSPSVRKRAMHTSPRLNAVTLVGPSGTGKTLLAKALGNYTGRKTYGANLSSRKEKWVGASEANARKMFAQASAMNNIILYFDEFNEQVEGGGEDGSGGGHSVDKALRQYLMEWLDTHYLTDDVIVVLTANGINDQHMGLYRRLGKIFYVGHPGQRQKEAIWQVCIVKHKLTEEQVAVLPDDTGWVGEDINACCAFAWAFGISVVEAAKSHVVPSSDYASTKVEALKSAVDGVCFDAETGEVFRKNKLVAPDATGSLGVRVRRKVRKI